MQRVYAEKEQCCGCRACSNICPKQAIRFEADEYGFYYPIIDQNKCIDCKKCISVCDFQNRHMKKNSPTKVFAAQHKNTDMLMKSSSGGVFGALADCIIEQGGVVFGCVFNDDLKPIHIAVEKGQDYSGMHGSKYVQSNVGESYRKVKDYLIAGRKVLFSGTPCQAAALKSFLNKDYENLFLVDFACHGVPSDILFSHYIKDIEDRKKIKITKYYFRSKRRGWPGMIAEYEGLTSSGKIKKGCIDAKEEFYYPYFTNGNIMRPSCFNCKYATVERVSDITMGDFWGYKNASLDFEVPNGISVCLAFNQKAQNLLSNINTLNLVEIPIDIAVSYNKNFKAPFQKGTQWDCVMEKCANGQWDEISQKYRKDNNRRIMRAKITKHIPIKWMAKIKALLRVR